MAIAENVSQQELKRSTLHRDLLETIFSILSSHERRVHIPLVCKAWCEALTPSKSTASLWEDVEVHDLQSQVPPFQENLTKHDHVLQLYKLQVDAISRWLTQRRDFLASLTVFPYTASATPALAMAAWSCAFGQALPNLATSSKLGKLVLHGPGIQAAAASGVSPRAPSRSNTEAAGSILRGAFLLPSLRELHVYDIPWAASLHFATAAAMAGPTVSALPSHINLTGLRELSFNRSFYQGMSNLSDHLVVDGGACEAWAALGVVLQSLPLLERLDLAHTHAITYCDPARGVATAPWPALQKLRELSLAYDLSVQSPPPPSSSSSLSPSSPSSPSTSVVSSNGTRPFGTQHAADLDSLAAPMSSPHLRQETASSGSAPADLNAAAVTLEALSPAPIDVAIAAACICQDRGVTGHESDDFAVSWTDAATTFAEEAAHSNAEADTEADIFGPPILTVDASHALVELHSWLPRCMALTSLDLRCCGLEALPLAVTHLPHLKQLDLLGNPLVSMRLPGPLRSLTWLRFSLDRCYDMLFEVMAAEVGEELAAEEMWTVDVPAPQLEELQVDSCSTRALELLREMAPSLIHLRRLLLTDESADLLS